MNKIDQRSLIFWKFISFVSFRVKRGHKRRGGGQFYHYTENAKKNSPEKKNCETNMEAS